MNNLTDLKKIITESSQLEKTEVLISLRAFLNDQEEYPWVCIENNDEMHNAFSYLHTNDINFFKNKNITNIKKVKIYPVDIFILPKNKRIMLIEYINQELENLLLNKILLVDSLRANPFESDIIFNFISNNQSYLSQEIINTYIKRSKDLHKLLIESDYKQDIYENCVCTAKKNKIKDYWKNLWGDGSKYSSQNSLIDNILL